MTRRSRRYRWLVVLAVVGAWWAIARLRGSPDPAEGAAAAHERAVAHERAATPGLAEALARAKARPARIPFSSPLAEGDVTIAGRVIDLHTQAPVGNVEVVFRSAAGEAAGEASTTTGADGTYAIQVATGMYRAFVRDDTVLSVGRSEIERVPGRPSADAAGVPDEALMAMVLATSDTAGVDLPVVRGGIVVGHVVDPQGHAIAGAVVQARGRMFRPALGTDVAESDRDGSFELRLPAGAFALDANHPRFAGVLDRGQTVISVEPGAHLTTTVTLTAGCVISGNVVRRDGSPAGDGAIERQWGTGDFDFTPAGRIEPDGTFRWVTTETASISLRAWPWKSPPSPSQRFACHDGARYDHVVLKLTDAAPALAGVLVDAAGGKVAGAYVDVQPLDPGGLGQQERTDAEGNFEVYALPPGRYRVVAQAEGHGITSVELTSPATGLKLALGGTGRLEGTTPGVATGSFEVVLGTCIDDNRLISLPESQRLVSITGGHYAIDGLPACELTFAILWHGKQIAERVIIPSGSTASLPLDFAALGGRPIDAPGAYGSDRTDDDVDDDRKIEEPDEPEGPYIPEPAAIDDPAPPDRSPRIKEPIRQPIREPIRHRIPVGDPVEDIE